MVEAGANFVVEASSRDGAWRAKPLELRAPPVAEIAEFALEMLPVTPAPTVLVRLLDVDGEPLDQAEIGWQVDEKVFAPRTSLVQDRTDP